MMHRRQVINLVEWAFLGTAVALFSITEQYHWYITVGMLLLSVSVGLRWLRTRKLLSRSGLELPGFLFLCSAVIATWIAIDQRTALLQFARILGAVVLFYAVIQSESELRSWLVAGFVLLVVGLAVYWPLQHDFSLGQTKFQVVARIGNWLNQHVPAIPGPSVHSNVAAGSLAPGLPFSIALAFWAGRRKIWLVVLSIIAILLIFFALVMTSSRGAWLACGATIVLVGMVAVQRKWFTQATLRRRYWVLLFLITLCSLAILVGSGMLDTLLGRIPDPTGVMQSRTNLWQQGLLLVGDTPFTGIGLMGFRMVYAVYGTLIDVPHHDHLHNTYLEVGLEQGLLGLFVVLWGIILICTWAWNAIAFKNHSLWGWAGMAALCIIILHGVVDVVFYVERTLPLIGLFIGMAYFVKEPLLGENTPISVIRKKANHLVVPIILLIIGVGVLVVFHRSFIGAFFANLGVVEQNRLELQIYDANHFDNPTLDEVRQHINLSRAVGYFEKAVRWDWENRTARQRMAEISLSKGYYAQAFKLMQDAWDAGCRDEITRLLYGDVLAAQGYPGEAAEVVRGLPWASIRLNGQAWYRYYRQADYKRAAYAWQAVLALEPGNSGAMYGLELLDR